MCVRNLCINTYEGVDWREQPLCAAAYPGPAEKAAGGGGGGGGPLCGGTVGVDARDGPTGRRSIDVCRAAAAAAAGRGGDHGGDHGGGGGGNWRRPSAGCHALMLEHWSGANTQIQAPALTAAQRWHGCGLGGRERERAVGRYPGAVPWAAVTARPHRQRGRAGGHGSRRRRGRDRVVTVTTRPRPAMRSLERKALSGFFASSEKPALRWWDPSGL